jgi:hypothetical protein
VICGEDHPVPPEQEKNVTKKLLAAVALGALLAVGLGSVTPTPAEAGQIRRHHARAWYPYYPPVAPSAGVLSLAPSKPDAERDARAELWERKCVVGYDVDSLGVKRLRYATSLCAHGVTP